MHYLYSNDPAGTHARQRAPTRAPTREGLTLAYLVFYLDQRSRRFAAVREVQMKQPRNGSLFALAWMREQVAEMSDEAKKRAHIVEVVSDDDAILGQLFHAFYAGALGQNTYAEIYATTDAFGKFATPDDRLVAAMMLRRYRVRRG